MTADVTAPAGAPRTTAGPPPTPAGASAGAFARTPAGPRDGRWQRWDPRRLPGWAQALVVLAASRVLFTFVALRAVDFAGFHRDGTHWTYLQIANNWDGTWYQRISLEGYPVRLPHDVTGAVAPNTWAFFPLYPGLVRAVETLGLSWAAAGTVVSVGCAAVAVMVIRAVVAHVAGPRIAFWTTVLTCFFPSALVLQLPYSEALALALLAGVLWGLQRGRYLLVVPLLLLVGLARPIGVPLAGVLTVHLVGRAWSVRALPRARAVRALAGPAAAWLAAGLAAVEWPLIAWWRTGVPDAYTRTMSSWRTPHELVPVQPWMNAAHLYFGLHVGPVVLVAGIVLLAWWLGTQGRRVVGPELTAWCACYAAYLLAVLDSFTSLPRYLLPLFPLGAMAAASSRSRAFGLALAGAFAVLGVIWMLVIWRSRLWAP